MVGLGLGARAFTIWMAGLRSVTIHSARNSIIFASRSGRNFSTSVSVDPTPGAGMSRGKPSVFLAYMSAKYRRHILVTHCAGFSISMAFGHRSGVSLAVQQLGGECRRDFG